MPYEPGMDTTNSKELKARLKELREERDALVGAISWLDEPEVLDTALRTLRSLEGEIARLEQQ